MVVVGDSEEGFVIREKEEIFLFMLFPLELSQNQFLTLDSSP